MKFSIRFADQIVGTLVILALAILVFVIFMLGKNQRWFAKDKEYYTYFSSATGLSPNMDIKFKGFTIGHVKKFSLEDDDRVKVTLTIFDEYTERVKDGSLVELSVSPIGLGNSFNFFPGKGNVLVPEGTEIPEVNSALAKDKIEKELADRPEASDMISGLISQLTNGLNQIELLSNLASLTNTIDVSLADGESEEIPELGKIVRDIKTTTEGLTTLPQSLVSEIQKVTNKIADQSVMALLEGPDGPINASLVEAISSLAGIVDSLETTSAFIPDQFPLLLSDINDALRSVQGILESVANNPLLKGGIPERKETGPGAASPRDIEFY